MANGIFGNMFDFDGSGGLDAFEQAAEFMFLQDLISDDESDEDADDDARW